MPVNINKPLGKRESERNSSSKHSTFAVSASPEQNKRGITEELKPNKYIYGREINVFTPRENRAAH